MIALVSGWHVDGMVLILFGLSILILVSFWRAHRRPGVDFNAFDLIMENGKVSKIAVAFMAVLGVTTWVIVDLQIKGKLTEGFFTFYGGMWVVPLVAKVVFQKSDVPDINVTTTTTKIESKEVTKI